MKTLILVTISLINLNAFAQTSKTTCEKKETNLRFALQEIDQDSTITLQRFLNLGQITNATESLSDNSKSRAEKAFAQTFSQAIGARKEADKYVSDYRFRMAIAKYKVTKEMARFVLSREMESGISASFKNCMDNYYQAQPTISLLRRIRF